MIILANKEVYRLDIKVGVTGDGEAKTKLTATEKMAEQTKKKMQALDKIKVSPTAKLNDQASNKLDKIKSNAEKLNNKKINLTAKLKDEISTSLGSIGSKISNFAKKTIVIGATTALVAGGIVAGTSINKFATFEKGLSNVKAVTHATDVEMKTLKDTALSLGASTAWSAVEVTQAEELLGQAGFSVQETITALPGLLSLASAGGLDLAAATDIASGTLRAFNLNASESGHVADVLALSASATNSDVTDLGESMKYVAPVAQSLGISLEDTAAATGLLSNANIKGSQAGTVLRQTMARLASPTSEAAKIMQKYGINAFDAQGNMKPLSNVVDNLNSSLGKLTSQQRADVISTIFGTESMSGVMALMNQGGESLGDLSQKLKDAKGSADEMANTKLDNLSGQWEQLKGAVETAQIQLGEKLAPHTKEFVIWLTDKIPVISNAIEKLATGAIDKLVPQAKTFAKWIISKLPAIAEGVSFVIDKVAGLASTFNGLSSTTKNAILSIGLLAVAFGPLSTGVSMIAGVGSGIGKLVQLATVAKGATATAGAVESIGLAAKILPALFNPVGLAIAGIAIVAGTAIVANNNLLKKSLSTTTEELGPVEKIMNNLHGGIYKSKEEMQQLGLAYKDFGENISDNFKKKVQESTKSIREFQLYINKINLDDVISASESTEFDKKINDMCTSAIQTIEENKSKSQESMKAMFMDDGTFSDAEKATLEYLSKDYDNKVTREQQIKDEIYNIRKKAIADHGKLYDNEIALIKEKLTEMSQLELESAGGNTDELLYAKNKFKARAQGLDIKDGSELAQEASKDRDSRIVDVKATYDTSIDKLKADLVNAQSDPNATSDTIDKIKTSIAENEQARLKKIGEINKLWNEDIDTLYKMSPNLKDKINKYDGTELSENDIEDQNSLEKIKQKYSDINGVTKEGFYGIRDDVTKTMNSIYVSVDERTGEITGAWNTTTGEVGAYTDAMKNKVKELVGSHKNNSEAAIKYLGNMGATVDRSSNSVKVLEDTVGILQNVSTNTYGVTTSIANINGTPLQITSNAEGVILNIKEVDKNLRALDGTTIEARINLSSTFSQAEIDYGEQDGARFTRKKIPENYTGTTNGVRGINSVAERGFEIVTGRQFRWFNGGEKVLNHEQSKSLLQNKQNNEPFQVKQGQYQVFQPQMQVAGAGGVSVGDIHVSVNGSQDTDGIVQEVVQVVGHKLKESLTNIKK